MFQLLTLDNVERLHVENLTKPRLVGRVPRRPTPLTLSSRFPTIQPQTTSITLSSHNFQTKTFNMQWYQMSPDTPDAHRRLIAYEQIENAARTGVMPPLPRMRTPLSPYRKISTRIYFSLLEQSDDEMHITKILRNMPGATVPSPSIPRPVLRRSTNMPS